MPRVSVVIPTFNMAEFLPQAIESVLSQAWPEVETIVVDDGSTDGTESVVRPYLRKVGYYRHENQGVWATRNQGIRMAQGQLIRFLDADDLLAPGSLVKQVDAFQRDPHVALVWGRAYVMDREGSLYGTRVAAPPKGAEGVVCSPVAFRWLLRGNSICNSTVMVRRSALNRLAPLDRGAVRGEDWEMWLRLAAHYDLAYIPSPLAYYRTHANSLTSRTTVEMFRDSHLQTVRALFAGTDNPYRTLEGLAQAYVQRSVALSAAWCRQPGLFARHFLKALARRPDIALEWYSWYCLYEAAKAVTPMRILQRLRQLKRHLSSLQHHRAGPLAEVERDFPLPPRMS